MSHGIHVAASGGQMAVAKRSMALGPGAFDTVPETFPEIAGAKDGVRHVPRIRPGGPGEEEPQASGRPGPTAPDVASEPRALGREPGPGGLLAGTAERRLV